MLVPSSAALFLMLPLFPVIKYLLALKFAMQSMQTPRHSHRKVKLLDQVVKVAGLGSENCSSLLTVSWTVPCLLSACRMLLPRTVSFYGTVRGQYSRSPVSGNQNEAGEEKGIFHQLRENFNRCA